MDKQETIDAIKKLYRFKDECPVIDSKGCWDDKTLNECGILQLNRYCLTIEVYGKYQKIIKRTWFKKDVWNSNALKKESPSELWHDILYHDCDCGYDGSKSPKNSVKIQGIMFIELCQCEAIPYDTILKMATTLKTKRRAVYRLHRIVSNRHHRLLMQRREEQLHETIAGMIHPIGDGIVEKFRQYGIIHQIQRVW